MTESAAKNFGPVAYTSLADGVVRVALNRPEVRNAMDSEMLEGLLAAFACVEADEAAQISAEEAMAAGFVNRVMPAEQFDQVILDWAKRLAAKSPLLVKLGKRALFEMQDQPLLQAMAMLAHYLTLAQGTDDVKEGVAAFMEKRAPVWKGH